MDISEEQVRSTLATEYQEERNLHVQIDNLNKEINRKTYMASGLLALILKTNNQDLINRATEIMNEAEKI